MSKILSIALTMAIVLTAGEHLARAEVIVITPTVSGTIRNLPEFGILERAPVGSMVQSHYFKTTDLNREFRRGFMEFSVPLISAEILGARLILPESRAWKSFPLPPDVHNVSYYPADLIVDTDDFDRPTEFLARIETDVNLPTQTFSLDVTTLVTDYEGGHIGFRIKLDEDPMRADFGTSGTGISEPFATLPARLEITVVPEPRAWHLLSMGIASMFALRFGQSIRAGLKRLELVSRMTR